MNSGRRFIRPIHSRPPDPFPVFIRPCWTTAGRYASRTGRWPTLGLTLAAAVARDLGFARYVPLGTSRKFWYEEELSVPLSSITTPEQQKRLYVDPRMLPLIQGKRVALVDDVISSGTSIVSGLSLMRSLGIEPVVVGAAMLQSERWHDKLDQVGPEWRSRVVGVFRTPLLSRACEGAWTA